MDASYGKKVSHQRRQGAFHPFNTSRNHAACKAIEFYSGYVANKKTPNYLPTIVISTLKNILACSDDRRGAQLYRIAVELSVLLNIIAATNHFSKEEVRELRESCEEEVKRLNGTLRLDDAVRWQNS